MSGAVIGNGVGIGTEYTVNNVRGTTNAALTLGASAIRGTGSMSQRGALAYTGGGWAMSYLLPLSPAIQTRGHEVFSEGWADIDCAQNGVQVQ